MTTVSGPIGRSHRALAPTPSIKHCFNATIRAADHLDAWIRRYVIEHPLRYRPSEFCVDQSPSANGQKPVPQKPVPPFSRVSASHPGGQARVTRPSRNRGVFVRDQSVLLSLGHCLRAHYDALSAPVPPHIAALVQQLDRQK